MSGTLLIVDDVATNRILLKVKLAAACYATLQAETGRAALAIARRARPDLILLDLELPDIDGVEICRRLRADPATRAIPIIMVTAFGDGGSRLAALAAGADDFLTKPVDDQVLLARVRSLLRARETEAELALREATGRELGFVEAGPAFEAPASIALIAATPERARGWSAQLALRLPRHRLTPLRPGAALIEETSADAFVLAADLSAPGDGLRLLSELRSRPATRHAAMCVVVRAGDRTQAAMALDLGANDIVTEPIDAQELALRLQTMVRRKRQSDRLRASLRDGVRQSVRDALTGLYNRRYALPHLARVAERARLSHRTFGVLAIDLDRFKLVNDRWGHAAGDAVLVEVARRLQDNMRAVDLISRLGGEEFLAVLPDCTLPEAQAAAERLRRVVEAEPVALAAGAAALPSLAALPDPAGAAPRAASVPVTLSVGLALGTGHPDEDVLELADRALLSAKAAGRNTVTVWPNAA